MQKPATKFCLAAGLSKSFLRSIASAFLRSQQVRQPATHVVVMPRSMMAVNG